MGITCPKKKSIERHIESYEYAPAILQVMDQNIENGSHQPFFISLLVNNPLLHNYILYSEASSNVMTRKFMEKLNLRILRPYHNFCAMDSREIKVHGLIKYLQVHLAVFSDISVLMDVVFIDVLDAWGMILSWKWATSFGGSIQMDLSYATIPTCDNTFVRLNR